MRVVISGAGINAVIFQGSGDLCNMISSFCVGKPIFSQAGGVIGRIDTVSVERVPSDILGEHDEFAIPESPKE